MANKLRDLTITKVDLVDAGANQDAHVTLFKRKCEDADKEDGIIKKIANAIVKAMTLESEEPEQPEPQDNPENSEPTEGEQPNVEQPATPEEATGDGAVADIDKKGGMSTMKIDKSKMTAEELAQLEEFEKKYGTPEEPEEEPKAEPTAEPEEQPTEEVEKGLNPEVAKQLEELKKFKESVEEKELAEIAKKYEVIGKKVDELVPVLKSLKAAGGTAYNDMIATMDECVEMVNKSGIFKEVGKNGHNDEKASETKVANIAKSYMEKDTSLSYDMAVAKAWEDHPELLAEYDEREGF